MAALALVRWAVRGSNGCRHDMAIRLSLRQYILPWPERRHTHTAGHRNLKALTVLVHQHEQTWGLSDSLKCLGMSPKGEGGIYGWGWEYSLCH